MNDGPGVYHIELHDSNDETSTTMVVAMSLYDAMQDAMKSHNEQYVSDVCTLDDITLAKPLTDEMLFFSKSAIEWIAELYGLTERSQTNG